MFRDTYPVRWLGRQPVVALPEHIDVSNTGTQLRLVVTAHIVRRVFGINGLDRLISVYPSLDAATAAGTPAPDPRRATRSTV